MTHLSTRSAWRCHIIVAMAVLLACSLSYFFLDKNVAYAMQAFVGTATYRVMSVLTTLMGPSLWALLMVIGFCVVALSYFRKGRLKPWARDMFYACTSILAATVICNVIKIILGRARPILLFQDNIYGFHFFASTDLMHSMPSGHATTAFLLATVLVKLYRRQAFILYAIATYFLITRVVLTYHYVSDVVLGAYLGVIVALIVHFIFNRYSHKLMASI